MASVAIALTFVACRGRGASGPSGPALTIPGSAAWRAHSTPLAIEYLRTLPNDRIGKRLAGIPLSDGQRWLEGFEYRGVVGVDHPGMHVVALAAPDGTELELIWIDDDGEPWPLPECGAEKKGVRARMLSGQVYTWKALRPGDGLVWSECPPADWPEPGPPGPPAAPSSPPLPSAPTQPADADATTS